MKTLKDYLDGRKLKSTINEAKKEYKGGRSSKTTLANVIWTILSNSKYGSKVKKVGTESRHPNQLRVHFKDADVGDVMEFQKELNGILLAEPTPFTSIAYDETGSGSKTYDTWTASTKTALSATEDAAFGECGDLDSICGLQIQLTYAVSGKKILKGKDLDPSAFGLTNGMKFTFESLRDAVLNACSSASPSSPVGKFERYIRFVTAEICGETPSPCKNSNALTFNEICAADLDCANKDFGEIACALEVLKQTRQMNMHVIFSEAENEKLVDFRLESRYGTRQYYFSVKNKGKNKGTAATILVPLWKKYIAAATWENSNPDSDSFKSLIDILESTKGDTRTKLFNAAKLVAKTLPGTPVEACLKNLSMAFAGIGSIGSESTMTFEKTAAVLKGAVNAVIEEVRKRVIEENRAKGSKDLLAGLEGATREEFINGRGSHITSAIYTFRKNAMSVPKETLEDVYGMLVPNFKGKNKEAAEPFYGAFVYPIGSNLVKSLNSTVNGKANQFLVELNRCLHFHQNFYQIETDISINKKTSPASLVVKAPSRLKFMDSEFKFEYNGMSKNSGTNRPLNFIMVHSKK